ncbi:efflux RND transporter periplasmic adaptor subunit [Caulobacter endophyticus]|uniref:Efflux RND transporter periplasmic adaptor subunit n=1 Tax=Caulobacter endophyticus TaxID=2172652 RepID=A0A2T9JUN1_9CAUL|nr:efflux RND transporter periplasmic adaptor subunit [Caulobacter endophyticus]PVM87394.1 efflux RND transporter periplasmic adaptor subunit [Caulobacter endophyticus]
MGYGFKGSFGRTTALALVLTVSAAGLSACGKDKNAQAKDKKPVAAQTVSVAPVAVLPLPRVINASGTISAWEEVPVGAETGGLTATAVNAEEGQFVRQGQVLVALNDTLLRAQLRQQEASVTSARATLAEAEASLKRSRELLAKGFLSQASLDTATARQATAAAQVAAAEAARGETAARVAQASIRAPVSGLIVRRSVTKGQIVSAGSELFRIVRDGRMELDAELPETDLGVVKAGMPASVTSEQVGQADGAVRIVTSEVDPQTRLGVARIALTSMGAFRPGMFARAQIKAGDQASPVVPSAAILYRQNQPGVFMVDRNRKAQFRKIGIVARTGDITAVSGVSAGEEVVVDGAGFLGDGDAVRVTVHKPAPTLSSAKR